MTELADVGQIDDKRWEIKRVVLNARFPVIFVMCITCTLVVFERGSNPPCREEIGPGGEHKHNGNSHGEVNSNQSRGDAPGGLPLLNGNIVAFRQNSEKVARLKFVGRTPRFVELFASIRSTDEFPAMAFPNRRPWLPLAREKVVDCTRG